MKYSLKLYYSQMIKWGALQLNDKMGCFLRPMLQFMQVKIYYCQNFINKMKKVGAIYSKTNNKENQALSFQIPTRRKQSIDNKSNCTQASHKDITDLQNTSTYHQISSQFSHQQFISDTQRYGQQHTFAENSFADSNMDSLDIQQQKVHQGLKRGEMGILEKLVCLQRMFEEMKVLRGLQRNRLFEKQLSVIENSLLNLQRQFIKQ